MTFSDDIQFIYHEDSYIIDRDTARSRWGESVVKGLEAPRFRVEPSKTSHEEVERAARMEMFLVNNDLSKEVKAKMSTKAKEYAQHYMTCDNPLHTHDLTEVDWKL